MLTDMSVQSLATAINGNLHCFFRYLQRSPVTEYYQDDGIVRWRTPVPHAWLNGVLCSRPPGEDEGPVLDRTLAYFKTSGVPAVSWWLEPNLQTTDWERQLARRGFHYERGTPGMAVDLNDLQDDGQGVPSLDVVTVRNAAGLRVWTHTMVAGFGLPAAWESGLFSLLEGLAFDPPVRHYVGYLNGQPAAIATLFLAAGVAGLQYLATIPGARTRGVGGAMALAVLREARSLGYRVGVLQSSEMGYNLYLRLGFRNLCHVGYFYWSR